MISSLCEWIASNCKNVRAAHPLYIVENTDQAIPLSWKANDYTTQQKLSRDVTLVALRLLDDRIFFFPLIMLWGKQERKSHVPARVCCNRGWFKLMDSRIPEYRREILEVLPFILVSDGMKVHDGSKRPWTLQQSVFTGRNPLDKQRSDHMRNSRYPSLDR